MTIHHGDCVEVMAGMDPESVDAIVCDPPYMLQFMGKAWDSPTVMSGHNDPTRPEGHGGAAHDHGFAGHWRPNLMQQWHEAWAREALRVAKPSAYLLAFGGTRTVHRMTVALEDAGWIIRDMLVWAYASGFPKSKASLKPAWEPIVMARKPGPLRMLAIDECRIGTEDVEWRLAAAGPSADRARGSATSTPSGIGTGQGFGVISNGRDGEPSASTRYTDKGGTNFAPLPGPRGGSPAGRWPANVILTDPIFDGGVEGVVGGTQSGILTACPLCGAPTAETSSTIGGPTAVSSARGPASERHDGPSTTAKSAASGLTRGATSTALSGVQTSVDGLEGSTASADILTELPALPPVKNESESAHGSEHPPAITSPSVWPVRSAARPATSSGITTTTTGPWTCGHSASGATTGFIPESTGGYSRFFLLPKADRGDREPIVGRDGKTRVNVHPTVKSTDLMRHLVRLVTPSGGVVLDPFLGSGTTALAAEMEGFEWIGIEREAEYVAIAEARLNGTQRGLGLEAS